MYALLIFAVALAVRLVHIWQLRGSPFFDILLGDANGYDLWAQRLAAGDWVGSEVFYQAPLYPYFLGVVYAVLGRDLLLVRIVQALIGSASCVFLGLAGARLFSKNDGLAAGLALALWAPAIFFDGLIQKSVLDMFFVCLSLWLISGIRDQGSGIGVWVALGASMAALSLTRENGLLLVGVIVAWILWLRVSIVTRLLCFVTGLALLFTPVVIRNYSIDGGFYLTTSQFGSNFYIGNNPNADGTYASIRFGRGSPEFERLDATEVAQEATGRALSPSEVSSFWTGRAMAFITSQPGKWLTLTGRKVLLLVNRAEMIDTEGLESHAEYSTVLWVLGWIGHFGLLIPLAVFGMIATWPNRKRLWIVYALLVTYAASVVLFFVFARYRYPLVPFLLLFAAAGVFAATRVWATYSGPRRAGVASVVVAVAIFSNWPVLSSTLMMSITENNLGTALQDQKQYDQAIPHHERAIALMPDYAPAYNNLGAALRGAGRLDEAVASYRTALQLKPDFASASYNLANALLEQGNAADSAASFRQSLQSTPNSVEAHNNLGIALASQGRVADALTHFERAVALKPALTDAVANRDQARAALRK